MLDDLAAACSRGAAAWWQRRPERYRPVTEADEQTRCCFVAGDERCGHATAYQIASAQGALDGYTYVCADHRRPSSGSWGLATS
jgi:hypothetical protein